jgi:hypothetical protein
MVLYKVTVLSGRLVITSTKPSPFKSTKRVPIFLWLFLAFPNLNNDGLDDIIKALANVTTTYINQGNSWKVSNNYALPKRSPLT